MAVMLPVVRYQSGASTAKITNDKIFIRTNIPKSSVYEQEPVVVTYKLYTLADVAGMNNMKMPDFNGFLKQELDSEPRTNSFRTKTLTGRIMEP